MFPTPWSVTVHPFSSGPELDAHNNPTEGFGDDRTEPVYGWAPAGTTEPLEVNRDSVTWDLDLMVSPTFAASARDEITANGVRYQIVGVLEDFNHGPFGFTPGGRIALRKVVG